MPMYKKPLLILISIIILVSIGSFLLNDEPTNPPPSSPSQQTASAVSSSQEISTNPTEQTSNSLPVNPSQEIAVYITGEVTHPGVVLLKGSHRLADAIKACGDFTASADQSKVNLASIVTDGQQINIPAKNITAAKPNSTNNNSANTSGQININTATEQDLIKLPGIGPALAKNIITYRDTNGAFKNIEDLRKVKGIGKNKFAKLKDQICL